MSEQDKACARACLRQVETGLAELRDSVGWWERIGPDRQREFAEFEAQIRAYLHDLQ